MVTNSALESLSPERFEPMSQSRGYFKLDASQKQKVSSAVFADAVARQKICED